MSFIGYRNSAEKTGQVHVGQTVETGGQALVAPVATLEDFWAEPGRYITPEPVFEAPEVLLASEDLEIVPPVLPGARIICIGLNYLKHVAEGSFKDEQLPEYPTLFARWSQSLTVNGAKIPVPADEGGLDWEGEIVAYVGRTLVDATAEEALDAVIGYSVFNDVTSRRAQKITSQWILGKNGDNSGPLGPLVPSVQVGDLRDGLRVQTRVNGTIVQDGNTAEMVYTVGDTLAHISRTFTLRPGDLLATGTPSGVGYARHPQWLLQPGDEVEVEVERIGKLRNRVVGNDYRRRASAP